MTKRKTKKTKWPGEAKPPTSTKYNTFETDYGALTIITTTNGKGSRAKLKRIRKKRIGVK